MSSEDLLKVHEDNKAFLRTVDFDNIKLSNPRTFGTRNVRRNSSIRIISRYGENVLLEYMTIKGNTRYFYRYVRVKDSSTGKFVFLSVPNNINNCKNAIAWTFGLTVKEYDLFFET